jgi:hypothetical protein
MSNLMKLEKVLMVLTLVFVLSGVDRQVSAAGAGKVIDILVHESGLLELLSNKGIRGTTANRLKNSALISLRNLNTSGKVPSAYELKAILKKIYVASDSVDATKKANISRILNKPHSKITDKEVTDLFNDLIFLSHRYGYSKTTALACSQCVSDALFTRGFKYTLEALENKNTIKIMDNHIPKSPAKVKLYIVKEMTNSKLGDFSKVTLSQVGKEEEKALGLFLGLARYGTKKQKAFTDAVIEISRTPAGKVELIDSKNSHKLWKIVSSKLTDNQLDGWTDILNKTATKAKGQRSKRDAFFAVLESKASKHEGMKKQLDNLKAKNCFFQ